MSFKKEETFLLEILNRMHSSLFIMIFLFVSFFCFMNSVSSFAQEDEAQIEEETVNDEDEEDSDEDEEEEKSSTSKPCCSLKPFEERFYVRGDVGYGWNHEAGVVTSYSLNESYNLGVDTQTGTFLGRINMQDTNAYSLGGGIGWEFGDYFRAELAAEWRAGYEYSSNLIMFDDLLWHDDVVNDHPYTTLQYVGDITTQVAFMNLYFDARRDKNIEQMLVPYIGGGLGYAMHQIDDVTQYDTNPYDEAAAPAITPRPVTIGADITNGDVAYNINGGLGIHLGDNLVLDLGFRYLNLGDIKVKIPQYQASLGAAVTDFSLRSVAEHKIDMEMHEARAGLRLRF